MLARRRREAADTFGASCSYSIDGLSPRSRDYRKRWRASALCLACLYRLAGK
jgi:hypothetical protein